MVEVHHEHLVCWGEIHGLASKLPVKVRHVLAMALYTVGFKSKHAVWTQIGQDDTHCLLLVVGLEVKLFLALLHGSGVLHVTPVYFSLIAFR